MRDSGQIIVLPPEQGAKSIRQAGRALDSSKESGYQQSVESKVNEFAEHRRRWLAVVAVWG